MCTRKPANKKEVRQWDMFIVNGWIDKRHKEIHKQRKDTSIMKSLKEKG